MLTIILQRIQRSIQTKEACLPAITAASPVTSDPIVHISRLRSQRFRRSCQQKLHQALSSLIPSEDLLFAITVVSMGMFGLSAPSRKLKRPKPRKKRPDKLIMALDLWLNIRLPGIRHPIKYHGDKHQGISIKPLGLMLLSISGLCSGLYQPITVALTRANPSI
jgi:hypothetical protein